MVTVMLSNPAAAATMEVAPVVSSFGQDLRYAWYSSGWASYFGLQLQSNSSTQQGGGRWNGKGAPKKDRPDKHKQETKEELESKVASIKIYPGNVTIQTGELVAFNAIAEDREGNAISGLNVKWAALHKEASNELSVPRGGMFSSPVAGTYIVTAEIAGIKKDVTVKVAGENLVPNVKSQSSQEIDSREFRKNKRENQSLRIAPVRSNAKSMLSSKQSRNKNLSASSAGIVRTPVMYRAPGSDEHGFNEDNIDTFDNAGSERGDMPGRAIDGGAGSSNYQFAAPAVSFDGRGIDLNLAFNYNSRLWHKAGSEMTFDIDRDWLNGWNIGYGKISMQGDTFMLTDADGTRHPYKGNWFGNYPAPHTSIQTFEAHTTDGTFIDYYAQSYKKEFDNSGGRNMIRAWAILPNGTRIEYSCQANYAMYPVRITDAHGNYITITYLNNEGPNITSITDTLGRVIQFHYDSSNNLYAISVPGLNGQGTRDVIRLNYKWINLADAGSNSGSNYGFASFLTTKVRNQWVKVLRAIYYPATATGYWFDDADSYSKYGMIRKVSERRNMSIDENGYISAGDMSHEVKYNHPSVAGYNDWGGGLTDTPTYTEMIEDWAGRQTATAPITKYDIQTSGNRRYSTITRPDGVKVVQITDNDQNSFSYGMLLEDVTYAPDGRVLKKSAVTWISGEYDSPRPNRTDVYDEKDQMITTYYGYGGRFNAPTDVVEYNNFGQYLHSTHTEYLNSDDYVGHIANSGTMWWNDDKGPYWFGQHIFNLPRLVEGSGPEGRISYTEYEYDQKDLIDNPNVPNHDLRYNSYPGNENRECRYYPVMSDPDCYCPDALATSSESLKSESAIAMAPDCDDPSGKDDYCPVNVVCKLAYDAKTKYRGLVTKVTRYADAVNLDASIAIVENYQYDINGNLRVQSTACCEQTTFNYTNNTRFAWPESVVRGSASDASAQNTSSAVYDYYTGLVLESYDANGKRSNIVYSWHTLRPEYEYSPTGGFIYHEYHDAELYPIAEEYSIP